MIRTENLSKIYQLHHSETKAVDCINLTIPDGKITGLLGVNGAGKTTTIKMLTTLLKPTEGKIFFDGTDIEEELREVKRKINVISGGGRGLYWRLTGKENLRYFSALYGVKDNERLDKLLKMVDLSDAADIPVERYSKGMKQRLKIAKGLVNDPSYLFLDEPTLGLDILIAHDFRQYIRKLAVEQNRGVVLTTHYIAEAEDLCDYIYLMDHGKVILEGSPEELKEKYNSTYEYSVHAECDKETMLNICQIVHAQLRGTDHEWYISAEREILNELCSSLIQRDIKIQELRRKEISLESVLYTILEEKRRDASDD